MLRSKILTLPAAACILSACAGMSEQACLVSDWRTVGFEDGSAGRAVSTIGNYRQACSKHGVSPDLDLYRAGHAQGAEIYCRPNNGFEVGRRGAAYQGVCPADLEPDFLAQYDSGRHLYQLESTLRRIDGQLASNARAHENIKQELSAIAVSMVSDETSAEQRVAFVSRAAELGRRHGEITNQTDALRLERAIHEAELHEYQEQVAFGF
jgi:hypothetical protein